MKFLIFPIVSLLLISSRHSVRYASNQMARYQSNLFHQKNSYLEWTDIGVANSQELRPDKTLIMGQCFNWKSLSHDDSLWVGVLNELPVAIKHEKRKSHFTILNPKPNTFRKRKLEKNDEISTDESFRLNYLNNYKIVLSIEAINYFFIDLVNRDNFKK